MTNAEKYQEVCRMRAADPELSVRDACHQVGLNPATHDYWKNKAVPPKRKHRMATPIITTVRIEEAVEIEEDVSIVIMKGKKSTIEGITRNLAGIFGRGGVAHE